MCYTHHNMQTLSAVSCQPSAVSCRSFRTRGHAFGAFPVLLKPHSLYAFSATDTTTTTTTTTTHPITMYHTHTPLHMFHHYIYQTPAMYQISQHYLSGTHYRSDLKSQFIRHTLHFKRSIPTNIYTPPAHAPTHNYFPSFL